MQSTTDPQTNFLGGKTLLIFQYDHTIQWLTLCRLVQVHAHMRKAFSDEKQKLIDITVPI